MVINGLLVACALVAVGAYLFSGPGKSAPDRPFPPLSGQGQSHGLSSPPANNFAPHESSEREMTDEQWARQQAMEPARSATAQQAEGPVIQAATPLAFLEIEPSTELTPEQNQAIQLVRQNFSEAMQSAGDPSSQAYLEKWAEEQNRLDELLTAYLGVEAVNRLHEANP